MPAERHFTGGRKPAQVPLTVRVPPEKGGFGLLQAAGKGLHPLRTGRLAEFHDRGSIPLHGSGCKRLDQDRPLGLIPWSQLAHPALSLLAAKTPLH